MRIDLLAVLLFETKDKLHWREIAFSAASIVGFRCNELLLWGEDNLRGYFKDMHSLE